MTEITDWKEVPIDDWKEVPVGNQGVIRQGYPPWVEPVRETSRALGMIGGGILGGTAGLSGGPAAPVTSPLGAVAGAGMGQAVVGGLADRGLEALGFMRKRAPIEAAKEAGEDILVGATSEASGQIIPGLINKVARPMGKSLYGRAMKIPPGSVSEEVRDKIIDTLATQEKIPLGPFRTKKINKIVRQLDQGITDTLTTLSTQGKDIDIGTVATSLDNLKPKFANRPNAKQYVDAIDEVKDQFLTHAFVNQGTGKISLIDAQNLKKGAYSEVEKYYSKFQKPETGRVGLKTDEHAIATAKAASALRDAIINHPDVPGKVVSDLKREAGLMNARKWVERATNRGANIDPIGLLPILFGMLVERGLPMTVAYRIAQSQPVMSRLAIKMAGAGTGGTTKTLSRVLPFLTMEAGRGEEKPVIRGGEETITPSPIPPVVQPTQNQPEETKEIDGITYTKINGKWMK